MPLASYFNACRHTHYYYHYYYLFCFFYVSRNFHVVPQEYLICKIFIKFLDRKIFAPDTSKRSAPERQRLPRPGGWREIHVESITDEHKEILRLLTNRQLVEHGFESSFTIFHLPPPCLHFDGCHEYHNVLRLAILRNRKRLL